MRFMTNTEHSATLRVAWDLGWAQTLSGSHMTNELRMILLDTPIPERETGIEPALLAWKARALPLSYSRGIGEAGFEPAASASRTLRADQAAPLSASVRSLDNDETNLSAPVNCECHRIIFVQLGNG